MTKKLFSVRFKRHTLSETLEARRMDEIWEKNQGMVLCYSVSALNSSESLEIINKIYYSFGKNRQKYCCIAANTRRIVYG